MSESQEVTGTGVSSNASTASSVERRGGNRKRMDLPALLRGQGDGRACRLTNYSPAGLFAETEGVVGERLIVAGEQLDKGSGVMLHFDVGSGTSARSFEVRGTIVRVVRSGVGVRLLRPDPEAVAALEEAVRASNDPYRSQGVAGTALEASAQRTLLNEACDKALAYFREQLEKLVPAARQQVMDLMDTVVTSQHKQQCLDSMREIDEQMPSILSRFEERVARRVLAAGEGTASVAAATLNDVAFSELSLLDNESFDDWLVARNLADKTSTSHRDQLSKVELCMGKMLGQAVEGDANPLGPETYCFALHDAVEGQGLNEFGRRAVYDAFALLALKDLGTLFEQHIAMFAARGIRPERPTAQRAPERSGASSAVTQPSGATQVASEPLSDASALDTILGNGTTVSISPSQMAGVGFQGGAPPVHGGSHAGLPPLAPVGGFDPLAQGGPYVAGGGSQAQAAAMTAASLAAPVPSQYAYSARPPMTSPYQVAPYQYGPAVQAQRAFSAARSMMSMHRVASDAGESFDPQTMQQSMGDVAINGPVGYSAIDAEDLNRLVGRLRETEHGLTTLATAAPLRERVQDLVRDDDTALDGQDADALDVIASLIDNITADPLVNESVKSRIRRMALPLLQVAVQDERVLADPQHPARLVVDQLGQLGLSADDNIDEMLSGAIDPIVDQLQGAGSAAAFDAALPKLRSAVNDRQGRFEKNIERLAEERRRQRELANAMRGGRAPRAPREPPEALKQWFDRAKKLNPGDVLDIDDHGETRRVILAIKDEEEDAFVFVDGEGEKVAGVTLQELALSMQRGRTRRFDDARTPAFERGLLRLLDEMHAKVVEEVRTEPVTDLLTRAAFEQAVDQAIRRANANDAAVTTSTGRTPPGVAVGLLTIEGFTDLRDKVGPTPSRSLLNKTAKLIGRYLRDEPAGGSGLAAEGSHFGDGLFAFMLPYATTARAGRLAERFCSAVQRSNIQYKGSRLALGARAGIAAPSSTAPGGDGVVSAAMEALESAESGAVVEYVSDSAAAMSFSELRDADRLRLRSQRVDPLDPKSEAKPHHEILLGKVDDAGELVPAGHEVLAAEHDGTVGEVDRWVVTAALEWMSANRKTVVKSGGYAVNLSGTSVGDPTLLPFVLDAFSRTRVPPGKVIFEVTETATIDSLSDAAAFIRTLREYGCRFALDDFGVGHASHAHLRQLPLDYVKIDHSFVRNMMTSPGDLAMVKSINELGQVLGKLTIAEGAESDEAITALREMGVNYAQGYAVAHPVALAD